MTVATHLTSVVATLYPSKQERESIASSLASLYVRLYVHFPKEDMKQQIQFGSSTRDTMLARKGDPQSDVDYMVVFNNTDNLKPQTFLDRLKRFAEKSYSTSEIKQSHPTVKLILNHIIFELVPAYRNYGTLYIPAPATTYSDWINTDPNAFNAQLEETNKNNSSQIKPMIRLLKYWNAKKNYVYNSYALEQWAVNNYYAATGSLRNYFFEAVNDLREEYGMAQWQRDAIQRAKDIVRETKRLEQADMPYSAEIEIKKLIPEL
jgi:hypothetical protein